MRLVAFRVGTLCPRQATTCLAEARPSLVGSIPWTFGLTERAAHVDDDFQLISPITDVETIARGRGIRDLQQLQRLYGRGNWRKQKGIADVRLPNGEIFRAEIHWYEAHGIGRRRLKVKSRLD